jgi:hypothetical protein
MRISFGLIHLGPDIIWFQGLSYQSVVGLSMPKFLAGYHYNEEEISRHLKKRRRILASPNSWQQVCNRSNPEETGRSCEGVDFSWLNASVAK